MKPCPLSAAQVAMLRRAAANAWGFDLYDHHGWRRTARSLARRGLGHLHGDFFHVTPEGRDAAARSDK